MKLGVLFSGGKDSTLAAYMAKKSGYELSCLISVHSANKESYMFHTPSISATKKQAEAMNIPIIEQTTPGHKEDELKDLEFAIRKAIRQYKIEGVVTGAVESVYQATRIQKICNKLDIECFNPLWQKPQEEILHDLLKNHFKVIIVGVFAYPLDKGWLGRKLDHNFIKEITQLNEDPQFKISSAGEGGEFESFVLDCPLFRHGLHVKTYRDFKEGENSWRREVEVR